MTSAPRNFPISQPCRSFLYMWATFRLSFSPALEQPKTSHVSRRLCPSETRGCLQRPQRRVERPNSWRMLSLSFARYLLIVPLGFSLSTLSLNDALGFKFSNFWRQNQIWQTVDEKNVCTFFECSLLRGFSGSNPSGSCPLLEMKLVVMVSI